MIDSHEHAFDEINTLFLDAWKLSDVTESVPIVWGNVTSGKFGQVDHHGNPEPYVRFETIHTTSSQGSLRGKKGTKRQYEGVVAAYMHVEVGRGYIGALPYISVAADAFTGIASPGGVWFRQPKITSIGLQGTWFVVSMTATFLYDLISK